MFVYFSVFEAEVRSRAKQAFDREFERLPEHPITRKAVEEVIRRIEEGSFKQLTDWYGSGFAEVRSQVDQVRSYRNWVAHGRRGLCPINITPADALERLARFLDRLDSSAVPE